MVQKQIRNIMLNKSITFFILVGIIVSHSYSQKIKSLNDQILDSANDQFKLYIQTQNKTYGNGAFQKWEQIGADSSIDHAITFLTPNDEVWSSALQALSSTYRKKNRIVDYYRRLELIRTKISRTEIVIQINWELANHFHELSQNHQAKQYFNNIITLGPTNPLAILSKSLVYELDSLNIGQTAPVFSVLSLDGKRIDISKYRGKVVVLDFWATWCAPCIKMIPSLHKIYNKLFSKDLIFIGISLDQNRDDVIDYVKNNPSPWIQICDGEGEDGQLVKKYNANAIPRLIVIDRRGFIAGKYGSTDNMERELSKLLHQ